MSPRTTFVAGLTLWAALLATPVARAAEAADPFMRQDDERILREAKVTPDAAGLLAFFRKRTLSDADRRGIADLIIQLGHRSFARRESASRKLESWGPPALQFLSASSKAGKDLEVVRRSQRIVETIQRGPGVLLPCAAARQLARLKPDDAIPVLLSYLPFADDESVQDTVFLALADLGNRSDRLAPLRAALKDPLPIKRAAAGFVLCRASEKMRAEARKLLADGDDIVRLRTAQGLLAARDRQGVPALIGLLTSKVPDVGWQAEDLLLRALGEATTVPAPSTPGVSGRKEYRDRWVKWWQTNGAKAALTSLEHEPAQRGWTVVSQMSTNSVFEIDRKGKTRWTISDLAGPIDARVLPGDRVLIAEHHGSKVTERNLQGTVVWEKRLDDRPIQVQRLPGGNTFICTYNALIEVTREGREVYRHRPEGATGSIYAGVKLRNGRIVCITLDGRIFEVESGTGKVLRSTSSGMNGCYSIQVLPRGHYLVSSYNEGKVHEIDAGGKVVWKYDLATAYHAERLPGGNTLISSHGGSRIVEVDRNGKLLSDHATNQQNVWRVHRR
jgi:hypothetical protein